MEEGELYNIVNAEIHDRKYDEDLWLKALKDNNGNEITAKREYLELRVAQLKEEIVNQQTLTEATEEQIRKPIREPVKKRNIIIGITLIVLAIILLVFLGDLLVGYFGEV